MERVVKGLVPLVVVVVAALLIFGNGNGDEATDDGAARSSGDESLSKASFRDKSSESREAAPRSVAKPRVGSTTRTATATAAPQKSQSTASRPTQLASRTPAATPLASPERRYVAANKLNIRAAPESGEVVARARKGDTVKVYAMQGGWARVSAAGKPPHWVAERLLARSRPAITYRVITEILKVRTAPAKGKIVASARKGDRVRVYAFEKRWARISPDGKPGRWVSLNYLSRTNLPADFYVAAKILNLRASPKTGKVVDRIEKGAEVKVYSVQDGWARLTKSRRKARWASLEYLSQTRTFE